MLLTQLCTRALRSLQLGPVIFEGSILRATNARRDRLVSLSSGPSPAAEKLEKSHSYAPREQASTRVPESINPEEPVLDTVRRILELYERAKRAIEVQGEFDLKFKNPRGVFANNELELADVDVFGFDYDYTLAAYAPTLHPLIYNFAKQHLVDHCKYPAQILEMPYNPSFSVRGLHFDVGKSLLMKIDSYHNIQLGTVYRGLTPVTDDEVREIYGGTHIPLDMLNNFYGKNVGPTMVHLIDLFSPPETMLLANTVEYFTQNQIPFDSEFVYWDVFMAIQSVHSSGLMYKAIMSDVPQYLLQDCGIRDFLNRLHDNGKKIFLITNSGFRFIETGLKHLIGPDWQDLFDVVVCQARKPKFFYQTNRPFRLVNLSTDSHSWDKVTELQKGQVYIEGNLSSFLKLTGWVGSQVLYFGDHVYSDLADVTLKHGWRTGAIIPELEREILIQSSSEFVRDLTWLSTLQFLIEQLQQMADSREKNLILDGWLDERDSMRQRLKSMFNPYFGSLFRTHHNPTYLFRRLSRFADIYTSALSNLLPFSLNHTFYPARSALPHEWQISRMLNELVGEIVHEDHPLLPLADSKWYYKR
ncbi:5'-nucleotidase domain-containing protein 3-like [Paramacrobiotus metropolitanus]|uniref:5'-nucleotidase domain-containing protein 3-like n=1 Tax=Paramacrobiotus metropolitanus TaxID=2943436 RepID=UPI0024456E24|nr:5'-nucleotidase domain-containing protein 3-like [Paramacrobiotus metropolitanus]